MSRHMQRFLAAAAYLFAVSLSFLPGLALWFWPRDRDLWLEAHGRSAALVNFAIFVGYLVLAPFTHILGLLATFIRLYEVVVTKFPLSSHSASAGAVSAPILYALWGPHYLTALLTSLASLGFVLLWLGAIVFNISSAWRAARGLGPWGEKSGKTQAQESKGDRIVAAATTAAVSGVGVSGRRRMMATGLPSPGRKRRDQDTPITPGPSLRFSRPRRPPGYEEGRFDGAPGERETLALETALETREQTEASVRRQLLPSTAAFAIYLAAAALLLLVPLHFDLRHRLIAHHRLMSTDPSIFLWSLAWWPWAISHGWNLFHTSVIWAPLGQNLLWMTSVPSLALLLAPVTHFFGPIASYNLIALLSPVLGAWAAYLLCRHVTGRFWPALFGGWLFGFSTYEFMHLQLHMNLFVTVALPLAVWLYLLRREGKSGRWWYVGVLALLVLFQFGVSTEILATAVPLGVTAALMTALLHRPQRCGDGDGVPLNSAADASAVGTGHTRRLPGGVGRPPTGYWSLLLETTAALALAGLVLLPCFYNLFLVQYPPGGGAAAVANPLPSFVLPTPVTWLGGQLAAPIAAHLVAGADEQGGYFGLPLLVIAWLFAWEFIRRPGAFLVLLQLAASIVLSFGPWLQLMPLATTPIPAVLPWAAVAHLPVLEKVIPARLVVYAWLAMAVVGAWWLAESRIGRGWKLLLAVLTVASLLPNIAAGYWVCKPPNPPFFTTGAAARYLPQGARVVVLPYGGTGYSMLWQAESQFYFSMAGGYVAPTTPLPFSAFPAVAAFYAGRANGVHYPAELRQFIGTFRIQAFIIADQNHQNPFSSLVAPLHVQPIHVGGVWLYRLPLTRRRTISNQ